MAWRLALSLQQLRSLVNEKVPLRSKNSDGAIGDEKHQSRDSDHNPWISEGDDKPRVVSAIDLTHDPKNGFDSYYFADSLLKSHDPRIKYIISNGRIGSGLGQGQPAWTWRPYTGKNKHDHHVHISVKADKALYDSTKPWKFDPKRPRTAPPKPYVPPPPTIQFGDEGERVKQYQTLLSKKLKGLTIDADGYFGQMTYEATVTYQNSVNIVPDGVVGPQTWAMLGVKS